MKSMMLVIFFFIGAAMAFAAPKKSRKPSGKGLANCEIDYDTKFQANGSPARTFTFTGMGSSRDFSKLKQGDMVGAAARAGVARVRRPSDKPQGSFESFIAKANRARMKTHAYLEGPGGATGGRGMAAEVSAIKGVASSWGMSTGDWFNTGWRNFTREQLKRFNRKGVGPLYSMEIDNLDNARGVGYSGAGLVKLLVDLQKWQREDGHKTKIVLKNLKRGMIAAVADALRSGVVKRETIAEFAISEESVGDKACTTKLYGILGIQQMNTTNTHRYQGAASYKLRRPASVAGTPTQRIDRSGGME